MVDSKISGLPKKRKKIIDPAPGSHGPNGGAKVPDMPQKRTEIAELRQRCCGTDERASLPETFEHEEFATKRNNLDGS